MIQKLSSETIETIISNKSLVSFTHIIKELLDNAIDAHANNIVVKLFDNGLERIEVIDNGKGVDNEQLKFIFDRNFTSKTADNTTIGFKGDALASLSHLAKVSFYSNGHVISKDRINLEAKARSLDCPTSGCKVVVSKLFSDYPVRLKHLRNHIKQNVISLIKYIKGMSLVYPHISFQLYSHNIGTKKRVKQDNFPLLDIQKTINDNMNGKITPTSIKAIKNRIADVYSIDLLSYLREVTSINEEDEHSTSYSFLGLFSKAGKVLNRNCNLQKIYINNNLTEFPKLRKLLNQLYKNSPTNNSINNFFYIVNILITKSGSSDKFLSPLKDRVVLENEQSIIDDILNSVRSSLFKSEENLYTNRILSYSNFVITKENDIKDSSTGDASNKSNFKSLDSSDNQINKKRVFNEITNIDTIIPKEEKTEIEFISDVDNTVNDPPTSLDLNKAEISEFQIVGQFNSSFIVCKHKNNLVVLDQHASDEIITYYRLLKDNRKKRTMMSGFLINEVVEIDKELINTVKENLSLLRLFGFSISRVFESEGKLEIDGLSVLYSKEQALNELEGILANIKNGFIEKENLYPKSYLKEMATTACRSSIMIGDMVNKKEMQRILRDLSGLEKPWNCPHGRPTMTLVKRLD